MMMHRTHFTRIALSFVWLTISGSLAQATAAEPSPVEPLRILFLDEAPLEISQKEFRQLPRTTVSTQDANGETIKYRGVSLYHLLERSMTPLGEALRGDALLCYVSVEAQDGYRVVFSLPELDPHFSDRIVILADEQDGRPLDLQYGPYRIIVPDEKRHARWVRSVETIRILESKRPRSNR